MRITSTPLVIYAEIHFFSDYVIDEKSVLIYYLILFVLLDLGGQATSIDVVQTIVKHIQELTKDKNW